MTVLDRAGVAVRRERYTRADVELTARELFEPNAPPGAAPRRAAAEARWNQIAEMMPKPRAAAAP